MGLDRLAYPAVVLAPTAFLVLVAVGARQPVEAWERPTTDEVRERQIDAYIQPLRLARTAMSSGRRADLLSAAQTWLREHERGRLPDLTPSYVGDTSHTGVKLDILQTKLEFARRLRESSVELARQNRREEALQDALVALRVTQIGKYADLHAVAASSRQTQKILSHLLELAPRLSQAEREQLKQVVAGMERKEARLASLLRRTWLLLATDSSVLTAAERPQYSQRAFQKVVKLLNEPHWTTGSFAFLRKEIGAERTDLISVLHMAKLAWAYERASADLATQVRAAASAD